MEPACVRYDWFTLRLPTGWQFTGADKQAFRISGPGGSTVEIVFLSPRGFRMTDVDKHRRLLLQLMQNFVENRPNETDLPAGVLWAEAMDVQGQSERMRIALFNMRPQNLEDPPPPILQVTCTMPNSSPGSRLGAERFEQLRAALRGIEWH